MRNQTRATNSVSILFSSCLTGNVSLEMNIISNALIDGVYLYSFTLLSQRAAKVSDIIRDAKDSNLLKVSKN